MSTDPEELRVRLLRSLSQVENTAERLIGTGQDIVRTAEESRAVAHDLQDVIREVPTGRLSTVDLQHLTSVFGAQERQQQALVNSLDSRLLSATTTTSTLSVSTVILGKWSTITALPSAPGTRQGSLGPTSAQQQMLQTIRRYSATNEMLRRLSQLRVKSHPSVRYPIELLQEGGRALTVPTGRDVTVTGVLIPAREGIHGLVMGLLRHLPLPAQAGNWRDRMVAIGAQIGLPGLDPDHFPNLGGTLERLMQSLSEGKQKNLNRNVIDKRFDDVLKFVIALLDSVDLSKVRTST